MRSAVARRSCEPAGCSAGRAGTSRPSLYYTAVDTRLSPLTRIFPAGCWKATLGEVPIEPVWAVETIERSAQAPRRWSRSRCSRSWMPATAGSRRGPHQRRAWEVLFVDRRRDLAVRRHARAAELGSRSLAASLHGLPGRREPRTTLRAFWEPVGARWRIRIDAAPEAWIGSDPGARGASWPTRTRFRDVASPAWTHVPPLSGLRRSDRVWFRPRAPAVAGLAIAGSRSLCADARGRLAIPRARMGGSRGGLAAGGLAQRLIRPNAAIGPPKAGVKFAR